MNNDKIGVIRRESEFASADSQTTEAALQEACRKASLLTGIPERIDPDGSLWFSFAGIKGVLPAQRADLSLHLWGRDAVNLQERLGRRTCFTVTGFAKTSAGETYAVLDRYAVQEQYLREVLLMHHAGDVIPCTVARVTADAAYCDLGLGILGILPRTKICVMYPKAVYDILDCGDPINAVVIGYHSDGKIELGTMALFGTFEENAAWLHEGMITDGTVYTSDEGKTYIAFSPNLYGVSPLLPCKYYRYGDAVCAKIKRIDHVYGQIRVSVLRHYLPELPFRDVGSHLSDWTYFKGKAAYGYINFNWLDSDSQKDLAKAGG